MEYAGEVTIRVMSGVASDIKIMAIDIGVNWTTAVDKM